jgi:hypothetical protein
MIVEQIWTANSDRNFNYLIACGASPTRCRCRSPSGAAAASRWKAIGAAVDQHLRPRHRDDAADGLRPAARNTAGPT